MRSHLVRGAVLAAAVVFGAASSARAQTCVVIDEAHDTLTPEERTAARLLIEKQFQLAGQPVASRDCTATYNLSHVRLGNTIVVSLAGPLGHREATALGLDDLPAVYSQMVRSLITGEPIGSMGVVDRTNVTAAQDLPPRRVASETYWHARLGYGGVFGEQTHGVPALGFGYRAEFDRIGLDISFFNYHFSPGGGYYGSSSGAVAGSLLKLEGLYFTNPTGNATPYFGGGLSWGHTRLDEGIRSWNGQGLQGELTAGYEIARATSVRLYLQADMTLPFYRTQSETYEFPVRQPNGPFLPPTVTIERRYTPALVVSVGLGWHRR
jgi:hypothetical protein